MQSKDFLKENLNILAAKFPFIHIRYGWDNDTECHIIEFTPLKEYYNNENFQSEWVAVAKNFDLLYPEQNVCFISDDTVLEIHVLFKEWNKQPVSINKVSAGNATFDSYMHYKNLFDKLSGYNYSIPHLFMNTPLHINVFETITLYAPEHVLDHWDDSFETPFEKQALIIQEKAGEYSYAMAA